ncbi:MAG: type II secretion system F family protein [Pseudomonadota bacterium]
MPQFHYRAVTQGGESQSGTLESLDEQTAAQALQARGLYPVRIARGSGGLMALLNTEITPRDALTAQDRVVFTRQLATLIGASLPLDRALGMIAGLAERKPVRLVAERLLAKVSEGSSFAEALDAEQAVFPRLYRAILRAGEAGAALETTLTRLADMLEETAKRRGEVRSALIYPAFLIVTAIGSVAILLIYVVPTFQPLLDEAGVAPPAITQAVIATGGFFAAYWPWMLGAAVLTALALPLALRLPEVRASLDRLLLTLPLAGRLIRDFESGRFARVLGTLLQNGVALPSGLRLTREVLSNTVFTAEIDRVIPAVEDGRGMAAPLEEGKVLSPLARQLIRVGQESGELTPMLLKTAEILEQDFKRSFDQALSLLTPILTLVMGALIAIIISSILFALFSINELAL